MLVVVVREGVLRDLLIQLLYLYQSIYRRLVVIKNLMHLLLLMLYIMDLLLLLEVPVQVLVQIQ
jgi:hypothetical protein